MGRRRVRWGLAALSLLAFLLLTLLVVDSPVLRIDVGATSALQRVRVPGYVGLMVAVSVVGYPPTVFAVIPTIAIAVARWLGRASGLFLVAVAAVQYGINQVIKTLIARPRPTSELVEILQDAPGYSFPSGHVMFFTTFFGAVGYLIYTRAPASPLRRLSLAILALLVILVGPSRIVLGAHWLSDVVAAYAVSLLLLLGMVGAYERWVDRAESAIPN